MSDKRIVFTRPDGGVSVIIPAPGVPFERVLQDVPADAIDPKEVEAVDLPSDRTFRSAWGRCPVKGCKVDLEKAKPIAHEKRRAARAAKFAPLDVEATVPALARKAEGKRQVIRDADASVQVSIAAASTEAELLAIVKAL